MEGGMKKTKSGWLHTWTAPHLIKTKHYLYNQTINTSLYHHYFLLEWFSAIIASSSMVGGFHHSLVVWWPFIVMKMWGQDAGLLYVMDVVNNYNTRNVWTHTGHQHSRTTYVMTSSRTLTWRKQGLAQNCKKMTLTSEEGKLSIL